jgi:hypothetical protein
MKTESNWFKELRQESPGNKFWTRGTKVNVGIALIVVSILLGTSIGFSVRTITNTGDNVDTFIRNSKGNYWTATGANLQLAVNDLSNATGWVDPGKSNNITLTTTLWLGTNCELKNFNFYLQTNADKAMIRNYSNAGNGIYIHDGYLNGNGINQPNHNSSFKVYDQPYGIYLIKCNNATVRDVTIYNTEFGGLTFQQSKNNIAERVKVFYAGLHHMAAAYTPGDCYSAVGLGLFNCSDGLINMCIVNHTWAVGIYLEGFLPCPVRYRTHHSTISNSIVSNTTIGIYIGEDCSNSSVINCVIKDGIFNNAAYALSWAVGSSAATSDGLRIIGCEIDRWDNGIGLGTDNLTISECKFDRIDRYTMELSGSDISLSNNDLRKCNGYQMKIDNSKRVTINGNHIYGAGNTYAAVMLSGTTNVSFSCNDISQSALHYPDYAIQESSTANWTRIDASNNLAVTNDKVHLHGRESWAMFINATIGSIGIERKLDLTHWIIS